ncbi:MAG: alpha/beta fold hydrolase, partial [Bacteroidota bacterium]
MRLNIFFQLVMVLSVSAVFVACKQKKASEDRTETIMETPEKEPQTLVSTTETFFHGFRDVDIFIDGIKIHAVVGGSGEPLLLLHGAPESHVMWRHLGPKLTANFTVVIPDLRGYGRSDKP